MYYIIMSYILSPYIDNVILQIIYHKSSHFYGILYINLRNI